jgi:hypothetical protein
MTVSNPIDDKVKSVKTVELIEKELRNSSGGVGSPFHFWLYSVKRLPLRSHDGYRPNQISAELWAEWQTAKPSELARRQAERDKWAADSAASEAKKKAKADAQAARLAKYSAWAEQRITKLQAARMKPVELEPVDFEELHALKKHPEQSKRRLYARWQEKFETLQSPAQTAWEAFHGGEFMVVASPEAEDIPPDDDGDDDADDNMSASGGVEWVYLNEYPPGKRELHEGNIAEVLKGLNDPAFWQFRKFNEGVRRLIGLIGNPIDRAIVPPHDPHRPQPAQELDDIPDNSELLTDIVPGLIPHGWTIPHGDASAGKSLWLQKLCLVVSDLNGAKFEGIDVDHGTVLYETRDPSASPAEVKPGLIEIRARLGLQPSGRFHLTGVPLILNEPESVEHWLELNRARLPCKVIAVDSLFSCVTGSLALDTVAKGVCDGVRTLLKHADAVVTPHHDNKSGDIFGSAYVTAMLASKIAVVRPALKDGRPGGHVTVTVERLKRADTYLKLAYTLDGPFLSLGDNADALGADATPVRRPDILKLLPTTATPLGKAFKLIEHLLTGTTRKSRSGQWKRLRDAWEAAGLVVVEDNTIRRVT